MNCREVRRWLSPYLDSELGETKTFEVSEHLRQCNPCATRFEQERRVDCLMAEKLADTERMDFQAMLREAVRPKPTKRGRWWIGVMGLAACVALLVWFSAAPAPGGSTPVEDWMASQFASATSHGETFVPVSNASASLLGQVESTLGLSLSMKSIARGLSGHVVKLAGVSGRRMVGGVPYIEVRLNCCGEPVLMAFALRSAIEKLGPLPAGIESGLNHRHLSSGLNIALWATDDMVFVATSRHPVKQFVPPFSAMAT